MKSILNNLVAGYKLVQAVDLHGRQLLMYPVQYSKVEVRDYV